MSAGAKNKQDENVHKYGGLWEVLIGHTGLLQGGSLKKLNKATSSILSMSNFADRRNTESNDVEQPGVNYSEVKKKFHTAPPFAAWQSVKKNSTEF